MSATKTLSLDDYDAVHAAVLETERGRWFLAEFAQRNRYTESQAILQKLAALEQMVRDTAQRHAAMEALAAVGECVAELTPSGNQSLASRAASILETNSDSASLAAKTVQRAAARLRTWVADVRQPDETPEAVQAFDALNDLAAELDRIGQLQAGVEEKTQRGVALLQEIDEKLGAIGELCQIAMPRAPDAPPTFLVDDQDADQHSSLAKAAGL